MAETEVHRDLMVELIQTLKMYYEPMEDVCVSGNLLVFYEEGNRRRHVSPDVFVTRGVLRIVRENYLIWEEGKGPEFVIELTSSSTKREDMKTKFALYRDVLKVEEYFLFDPNGDFLKPRLQGYRLEGGEYVPIQEENGRLPSQVTTLHLEADGNRLRLFDPASGKWLPTHSERLEAEHEGRLKAERDAKEAEEAKAAAEAELEQLRQEVQKLKRRGGI